MKNLNDISFKYIISLENRARFKLIKRYNKPLSYHDVKIINDILYNEKTHYVEQFKEYLIYEDYNEFLKRFYKSHEINIKLPKILVFYEKYSKIYANYTVIPESKYMYKNIKRKQKMIDQMQNNDIHNSEIEEDEDEDEDISNTIFSSRVIDSIYNKTLTTLNKSEKGEDISKNTVQSIKEFIGKINLIENKVKLNCLRNNYVKKDNKNKSQKDAPILMKKFSKEILFNKNTPKTSRAIHPNKLNLIDKNEIFDIQISHSKKILLNLNNLRKKSNSNSKNNINNNANNKNNYSNLIFINSYASSKSKNNQNLFCNNRSLGNANINNTYSNSNTFNEQKNILKPNINFPKQKLPTLLKQNFIKSSKNLNKYKENMNLTNINNYFTNVININNDQKHKLNFGETLLKFDKIVLSTNSSGSPKIMNDKRLSSTTDKINIFQNKNNLQNIKEKENEKQKIKKEKKNNNQLLSSNKAIYSKNKKSNLLGDYNYNSYGNSLTFLSHKFIENPKMSNKLHKKKFYKKNIENNNSNNSNKDIENIYFKELSEKLFKKPESYRNHYHSKMLSGNISNSKNKINSIINGKSFNINNKISVGLKHGQKNPSQKVIRTSISQNNSSSNFYFQSNAHSRKNSLNNLDKIIVKTLNDNNKKKFQNNFNIINNIHDNSTQINIYTGNDLYKSLHYQNNKSGFNNSNLTQGNTSSKSPTIQGKVDLNNKNKKNIGQTSLMNNKNNPYFKSYIKGKEKNKFNLDLKKIINKKMIENEKAIISERQTNNRKLFEKLGIYFFNKKEKNSPNINQNYASNNKTNLNIKINNSNKKNKIIKNNNDYIRLINKIINKNNGSSKGFKNKTNNNTPIKKYAPYIKNNNKKNKNICLSPNDNERLKKKNKASSRQNINYNNIINNFNDLKNNELEEGSKMLLHSDRNKNYNIAFKN